MEVRINFNEVADQTDYDISDSMNALEQQKELDRILISAEVTM